ncbi:unnamed protein product [Amoebophrya sp. A120]|nr:unnamed protein product [Amoebophrya sp. A120]|eukprot:GSA120T00001075001.1
MDLILKADKKLQGGGLMSFFSGPPYDEIQDLYEQACNQLKMEKNFQVAAEVYLQKLPYVAEKNSAPRFQRANYFVEGGKCLQKLTGTLAALQAFEDAITLWGQDGKYMQAGKLMKSIAEQLSEESLGSDNTQLIEKYYSRACDMFEMDDYGKAQLSACRLKLAEYAAANGEHKKAIDVFESEARACLSNNLRQYSAKDYFWQAGVLHLVMGDMVTIKIARDRYCQEDPRFEKSMEGQLFAKIVDALEADKEDDFTEVLGDYNDTKPLEPWFVTHLTTVKENFFGIGKHARHPLPGQEDLGGEEDDGAVDLS